MHAGRRIATLLLAALLLALPAAAGRVPMEQGAGIAAVSLWGQILTHLHAFLARILPAPARPAAAQSECAGGMDPNGRCG
ncbi:MAG TPA: hypothetical protein VHQ90_24890 [Thermoanaerobaculia bacterium]|nr:hypothetical protein [Thermoanaerobaculia bacterium]